ncbi:30S ribosomal S5, chloroplastic [Olea europaea subsp. europaea]|uniref:30S ribosomal S5, chloroplastic n=1 Tax=Olea europaea subsp. europaea TaxID=158383 RepID=A0A8S0VF67_OLEEU|nr:30S ribosomal S5, chloroplastic [Olea europaea subsp. europaea]
MVPVIIIELGKVAIDPNVNHDIPLLPPPPLVSPLLSTLRLPQKPISLRFKFSPINANSFDINTTFFDTTDPEEISTFSPPKRPEDFVPPPSFDEGPFEDEIAKAYEELYGAAYSGETFLGNNVRRVTEVVKGGKQLHFRAVLVVGDKQENVRVGVGKAKEVIGAVQKSAVNASRNIITVPMTKYKTLPHRSEADRLWGS